MLALSAQDCSRQVASSRQFRAAFAKAITWLAAVGFALANPLHTPAALAVGRNLVPAALALPDDEPATQSVAPDLDEDSWPALDGRLNDLAAREVSLRHDLAYASEASLDVPLDRAKQDMALARRYLDQAMALRQGRQEIARARFWADMAAYSLSDGTLLLSPSRPVEARGILIDADALPKTPDEVKALVDRLADVHFNILLPEIVRRGYAIYPSSVLQRDPDFASGSDIVPALIGEAHKRGLEVIPWIWTFRVRSYDDQHDYGNPVFSRLPALEARDADTVKPRFMSPANPLSRELVHEEVAEILDHYDIDGLFLDYIRYDERTP
ncbi:MAG: family 10 glycosylhydrolase, partial [Cyanobacteria bacterium REEB65]|nr:family 10 glycosylhydrolase [Cyanobacteria bacterium REEB65]